MIKKEKFWNLKEYAYLYWINGKEAKYSKEQETEVYPEFNVSGCFDASIEFTQDWYPYIYMAGLLRHMYAHSGIDYRFCGSVALRKKSEPLSPPASQWRIKKSPASAKQEMMEERAIIQNPHTVKNLLLHLYLCT